jgi:hypothetical protein
MKISLVKTSAFVSLLLFALATRAQNRDYVITVKGDTLQCVITMPLFMQNGKYQTANMPKPHQIVMGEIKEYYIAKKDILYRKVYKRPGKRGSAAYMIVLENGKINLYEEISQTYNSNPASSVPTGSSSEENYISKNSDTVKVLRSSEISVESLFLKSKKSRKNDFADMIKDNEQVYNKFLAEDKFSFKQIRNLVHLYNTGQPIKGDN